MALVIRWIDQVFEDLDDILEFIENKFGPDTSQEVFVKINNVVDLLTKFSDMGKRVKVEIRAIIIAKRAIVLYHYDSSHLIVLNVFDHSSENKILNRS